LKNMNFLRGNRGVHETFLRVKALHRSPGGDGRGHLTNDTEW